MEREEILAPTDSEAFPAESGEVAHQEILEEEVFESLPLEEREDFTNSDNITDFLSAIIKADKSAEKGDNIQDVMNQLVQQSKEDCPPESSSGNTPKDRPSVLAEQGDVRKNSPRAIATGKATIPRPPLRTPKESTKDIPRTKQAGSQLSNTPVPKPALTKLERNKKVLESTKARTIPAVMADTLIKKPPPFPSSDAVSDAQMSNITDVLQSLTARMVAVEDFPSSLLVSITNTQEKVTEVKSDMRDIKQTIEKLRIEFTNLATIVSRLSTTVNGQDGEHAISQSSSTADTVVMGLADFNENRSRAAARVNEASKPVPIKSSISQSKASEVVKQFKMRKF